MSSSLPFVVLFTISIAVWWCVLSPITIYYLCEYYSLRKSVCIRHRHWKIVILFGAFCILFWTIERPLELLCKLNILNLNSEGISILKYFHNVICPISIHGIVWCIVWRYWIIFYNLKFYQENINMKWKVIINNTHYNMNKRFASHNWFLSHRKTFGSLKWVTKRIVPSYMTCMVALIFFQFYSPLVTYILDALMSFYTIPILVLFWQKTPLIEDEFQIKNELEYIIIFCVCEWIFYFGGTAIKFIAYDINNNTNSQNNSDTNQVTQLLFLFIQSWSAILFSFGVILICTKWALNANEPTNTKMNNNTKPHVTLAKSLSMSNLNVLKKKLPPLSPKGRTLKLWECLQCDKGFNSFMNHLMSELSHECLLSIIEFVQWKTLFLTSYTQLLEMDMNNAIINECDSRDECDACNDCNDSNDDSNDSVITLQNSASYNLSNNCSEASNNSNHSYIAPVKFPHHMLPLRTSDNNHCSDQGSDNSGTETDDCTCHCNHNHNHNHTVTNTIDKFETASLSNVLPKLDKNMSNSNTFNSYKQEILTFQFPSNVPKSFIVYKKNNSLEKTKRIVNGERASTATEHDGDDDGGGGALQVIHNKQDVILEYKLKAFELFEKYVYCNNGSAEYEINISYQTKKKLINLMSNEQKWLQQDACNFDQLYTLFDDCIYAMYGLMRHSFQRFKKSEPFLKLDKKIFCKSSFPDTF